MARLARFFPTVMMVGLAAGCGGGQTGDLSGENGKGGRSVGNEGGCVDQLQEISLDDSSALGFDAARLLAFAQQRFQAELAWQAVEQVEYSPSASQSTLSLTLSSRDKAWFVHSAPKPDEGKGGPAIELICPPDRLRVAVHADLQSADGALAESFDASLEARSPSVATLSQGLEPKQVAGSFAITQVSAPGALGASASAEVKDLSFDAVLTPGAMAGMLTGHLTSSNGQVSSSAMVTFARFPSDTRCFDPNNRGLAVAVSAQSEALGQTGGQALSAVHAWGPIALTWGDGAESALTFELSELGDGCVTVADQWGFADPSQPAASVVYPVTLKATTADGHWQGQYSAKLVTWPNVGGGFSERIEMAKVFDVATPAATGFSPFVIPNGTHRLSVQLEALFDGATAKGQVSLNALKDPPCVTDPEPPSGNSAPGCAGTSITPVLGASWEG